MNCIQYNSSSLPVIYFILAIVLAGCATSRPQPDEQSIAEKGDRPVLPEKLNRPVPNPITNEIPHTFYRAVENGTRTMSGKPGPDYWQQYTSYSMNVELDPAAKKIYGESIITYHNNSPDTLYILALELIQNLHKRGVVRNEPSAVTGGIHLTSVRAGGTDLSESHQQYQLMRENNASYYIEGTLMLLRPSGPVMPGDSIELNMEWNFNVPQQGAGGRMGYSKDNLFFIAYWYPIMRVYDDVIGWFTAPFRTNAEFYHGFGDYQVNITVPEQWVVAATGSLQNGKEILREPVYNRLNKAYSGNDIVHVVEESDFGNVTKSTGDGKITWRFNATNIRDFAFSATTESLWDATRANVGDVDGDDNYSKINAFYRSSAPLWQDAAEFSQHSLEFLSDFTGIPYPWPHMTAVEGAGIIGGGMEYPMMTLIGSYNGRPPQALYGVIVHEFAHMWVPMIVSTNERRYSWIDEGTTTFNEGQARKDYYRDTNPEIGDFMSYLSIAGTGYEGEIMRWSDYHYNGAAYGVASYPKPASMLVTLRGLLGEEVFTKAYQTFLSQWQYKHPYPWDLFNAFEDASGRNLDWFWRSWYYETWILDQAVAEVSPAGEEGTRILIQDFGQVPMPAHVAITLDNGETVNRTIGVDTWLSGATTAVLVIDEDSEVVRVVIDPSHLFPDADRSNNIWER